MKNNYSSNDLQSRYNYLLKKGRRELLSTYELNERKVLKELLSQQETQLSSSRVGTIQPEIQFNF